MKSYPIAAISLIALASMISIQTFAASPHYEEIRFECPHITGVPSERLTNTGTFLSGRGEENIDGNKSLVLFRGIPAPAVPLNLIAAGYGNAGVKYNPDTARVSCVYTAGAPLPSLDVSYGITNGKKAVVLKSDNSKITVAIPIGLKN